MPKPGRAQRLHGLFGQQLRHQLRARALRPAGRRALQHPARRPGRTATERQQQVQRVQPLLCQRTGKERCLLRRRLPRHQLRRRVAAEQLHLLATGCRIGRQPDLLGRGKRLREAAAEHPRQPRQQPAHAVIDRPRLGTHRRRVERRCACRRRHEPAGHGRIRLRRPHRPPVAHRARKPVALRTRRLRDQIGEQAAIRNRLRRRSLGSRRVQGRGGGRGACGGSRRSTRRRRSRNQVIEQPAGRRCRRVATRQPRHHLAHIGLRFGDFGDAPFAQALAVLAGVVPGQGKIEPIAELIEVRTQVARRAVRCLVRVERIDTEALRSRRHELKGPARTRRRHRIRIATALDRHHRPERTGRQPVARFESGKVRIKAGRHTTACRGRDQVVEQAVAHDSPAMVDARSINSSLAGAFQAACAACSMLLSLSNFSPRASASRCRYSASV